MTCSLQWNTKAALRPVYCCQKKKEKEEETLIKAHTTTHKHKQTKKNYQSISSKVLLWPSRQKCQLRNKQSNSKTADVLFTDLPAHQQTSLFCLFPQVLFFAGQLCRCASAGLCCFWACNYWGLACCIFNCFIVRRDVLGKKIKY